MTSKIKVYLVVIATVITKRTSSVLTLNTIMTPDFNIKDKKKRDMVRPGLEHATFSIKAKRSTN